MPRRYKRRRRRRRKKQRVRRPISSGFLTVNLRKTGTATLTGTNTAANDTFLLNSFNQYSKFTAVFEQYRIVKVIQTIYPMINTYIAPLLDNETADPHEMTTVSWIPLVAWKIDRDDVTTFSSLDDALSNPKTKVRRLDKKVVIKFKPNLLGNTYGSVSDNNTIIYDRWSDTEDSSDAPYYGLSKFYHAQNASATYPVPFRIITSVIVQFKSYRTDE